MNVTEVIKKLTDLGPLYKDAKVMYYDGRVYQELKMIASVAITPAKPVKPLEGYVVLNHLKPDDVIDAKIL